MNAHFYLYGRLRHVQGVDFSIKLFDGRVFPLVASGEIKADGFRQLSGHKVLALCLPTVREGGAAFLLSAVYRRA